jgi:hypothetical protein
MQTFLKYLFIGFKYLFFQAIIEIILIITLEYLGFNPLLDFSKSNLLIQNIEGVTWAISMKTIIFCILYLPLFILISNIMAWKNIKSNLMYSIINAILNAALLLTLFLLKHLDIAEIFRPLIPTVIASLTIIIVNRKTVL